MVFNFNFLLYELFQLNVKASAIDNPKNHKLEEISKNKTTTTLNKKGRKDIQGRCFIL